MPLSASQRGTMSRADSVRTSAQFVHVAGNWRRRRWLPTNNRYARDCVNKIKTDLAAGGVRHADLASYIAASSVIHCMDGWSYLSRAMEAEMCGDSDAARHLAYYAELRAAMAILASAGVGVFDRKHFALTKKLRCENFAGEPGTHVFVWDALSHWAEEPSGAALILQVIRPGGKSLAEWLRHFPHTAGPAFQSVLAKHWLLQWGLDLARLSKDRNARNEASYRPTNITTRSRPTLKQSLRFIEGFWRSFEPSAVNSFKELDRHLLRKSLAVAFQNNHASHQHPEADPAEFERLLEPVLHGVLPTSTDYTEAKWRQFLSFRRRRRDTEVIVQASATDEIASPMHHIQVVCRATILLRVATGSAREMIGGVPLAERAQLAFWWNSIGESRGMWESGAAPIPLTDLWSDIEDSINRIAAWRVAGGASKRALFTTAADSAHALTSCERVGLWGLTA